jgi:RHS repeat-associated protein
VEVYRERSASGNVDLERLTVAVADDTGVLARVYTTTIANGQPVSQPSPVIRYQYGTGLGSGTLILDETGRLISYEEYHPYGTSAYRSGISEAEVSLKRYRFLNKERDDETGLDYFGARYYASWLGRWTSADPAGFVDGLNLYRYAQNAPSTATDTTGFDTDKKGKFDVVWSGTFSDEDQATLADKTTDPATALAILKKYGYPYAGPVKWEDDFGESGGWVDQSVKAGDGGGAGEGQGASEGDSAGDGDTSAVPTRPEVQPPPGPLPPAKPIPKVDVPQAPAGTTAADFKRAEEAARATYRANQAVRGTPMQPGEQVQHWYKWQRGRDLNLDPAVTNSNLSPLQSRAALSNGPYTVDGKNYTTPHTYADRGLIPKYEQEHQQKHGSWASERVSHVQAGRRARMEMQGTPGPRPPYIWVPTVLGGAGHLALAATRTLVPFVVEAEITFMAARCGPTVTATSRSAQPYPRRPATYR